MALAPTYVATEDLIRVAASGVAGTTAIVNVQHYIVDSPVNFLLNTTSLEDVCLEFDTAVLAFVAGELHDSYTAKDVTCTVYRNPFKVITGGLNPRYRMNAYASFVRPSLQAGLRAGAKLPDFNVYRPYKITGLAGRSNRGSVMFSPLLESDTDGNSWTAGFQAPGGPGRTLKDMWEKKLFAAMPTKALRPILFRIKEYLGTVAGGPPPNTLINSSIYARDFEMQDRNQTVGVLRRRRLRTGT